MIFRLREHREALLVLNFLYVATYFLQDNKTLFFHLGLNQNSCTCIRVLLWKNGGFVSWVTNPIVRKFWKMPSLSIHLIVQTKFSQQLQVWVHQSKCQGKPCSSRRKFDWKTIDIHPRIKPFIVQNFQKVVIKNDLYRLSKWHFIVTADLICFTSIIINNLTNGEKDLIQISVSWFLH